MRIPYDIVTFDCYGTLVDWETGIGAAIVDQARRDGVPVTPETALALHAEVEPAVQAERFRSYREVLRETALRIAGRLGWPLAAGDAGFLADSLPAWRAFPDTNPALSRLGDAGYALGVLSNIDDDLIRGTLAQFDAPFELIVTAEQVGAYKPASPHFDEARRRIGSRSWLHAAQSHFHDIQPASRLGIASAWVNRKDERPPAPASPVRTVPDMRRLADWLTAASA